MKSTRSLVVRENRETDGSDEVDAAGEDEAEDREDEDEDEGGVIPLELGCFLFHLMRSASLRRVDATEEPFS